MTFEERLIEALGRLTFQNIMGAYQVDELTAKLAEARQPDPASSDTSKKK